MERKRNTLKEAVDYLFWAAAGVSLIVGALLFGETGRGTINALIIAAAAVVLVHWHRCRTVPDYTKNRLGVPSKGERKRKEEYDWLRLFAVSMAILTHAIQMDIDEGRIDSGMKAYYPLTVLYIFCLVCNLIYVMLSGGLLLPYREEKIGDFYLRRTSRVILPMLVYFLFGIWMKGQFEFHMLGDMLRRLFQGETPEFPHYWLMYEILSIYVVVPFFRYMFKDMPYKTVTAMAAIGWGFMFFTTYSPIPCAVNPILASWVGVAVFGYWIMREESRKYDNLLILSGAVGLGVTMYCIKTADNFIELCCNCSPTMLMIAGGLFSLVFKFPKVFSKENVILSILSKYNYSLILIHWAVLSGIVRKVLHIYTNQYYYVGGILLTVVTTLAGSLAVAFVLDNMILMVVEQVYDTTVKYSKLFWKRLFLSRRSSA